MYHSWDEHQVKHIFLQLSQILQMKVLNQSILDGLHCKAIKLSAINKTEAGAAPVGEQYDSCAITTTQCLKTSNIIAHDSEQNTC